MPALHVVGEIVGASGLRPRDAFSVDHWLDFLSLHPSSTRSFFCRWRLRFRGKGTRNDGSDAEWRVLQGATRGQTQAHAWSGITPLEEAITKTTRSGAARAAGEADDDERAAEAFSLLELDTLWCHPIDLHLAIADVSPLPTSWPFLEFGVWSLDEFHHKRHVGTSSLALPLAQHEYFVDLPITKLSRSTMLGSLGIHGHHDGEIEEEEDGDETTLVARHVGTMFVRLAVVQQGFAQRGITS